MEADNIKDLNRYIVNQIHHGSISPSIRAEMWRDVYLEEGALIQGGIFGNSLNILQTNVSISESVYVRSEIRIKNSNPKTKGEINFGSVVVSPDSLVVEEGDFKIRFNSDLYISKLNLVNAIIYGNVYCSSAILKNCIVLGGIYCKNKLLLNNSIVYTFDTNELELKDNVSLLSPFGISNKPFILKYPVKALTFFNIKENSKDDSYIISLDENDIFELKSAENDNCGLKNKYLLSIVERILNSTEIIQSFRNNKNLIEFLSLGSHLDKDYSFQYKEYTKQNIEKRLWEIIDNQNKSTKQEKRKKVKDIIDQFVIYT